MTIPFTALYFASYETAKRGIRKHANSEESLLIQGVAGECSQEPVRGCGIVLGKTCLPSLQSGVCDNKDDEISKCTSCTAEAALAQEVFPGTPSSSPGKMVGILQPSKAVHAQALLRVGLPL